jgi:hypothetical protein
VNGPRRAGDVADADRGGQGRGQGLEVRNVAGLVGVVVAAGRDHEAMAQVPELDEPETNREEHAGPEEGDHLERNDFPRDGDAEIVDGVLDGGDEVLETFHDGSGEKTS